MVLLWPAIFMIVKASTPSKPSLVNMVCRNECTTKSFDIFRRSRTFRTGGQPGGLDALELPRDPEAGRSMMNPAGPKRIDFG